MFDPPVSTPIRRMTAIAAIPQSVGIPRRLSVWAGCDGNAVPGVHAHGIEIFDRADDDDVVVEVAHHLEFELLPTEYGAFDQNFSDRTQIDAVRYDSLKFLGVVGDSSARPSQGKGRAHDDGIPQVLLFVPSLFE